MQAYLASHHHIGAFLLLVLRGCIWLALMVAIFAPLEHFFAVRPAKRFHKDFATNLSWYFHQQPRADLPFARPIAREAEAREAEAHHHPGRGFRDGGADLDRDAIVYDCADAAAVPAEDVGPRREPERRDRRVVEDRGAREGRSGMVAEVEALSPIRRVGKPASQLRTADTG
jgi:hypothetical protein